MKIHLNGELRDLSDDVTLRGLIESLDLKPETIAVQINDDIINRHELDNVNLNSGDVVELIRIVGGG